MTNAFLATAAGNPENQDRGAIIDSHLGLVLVVADGAGGRSGGAEAAAMAVEFVRQNTHELKDPDACVSMLQRMDKAIADDRTAGETTCVLVVLTQEEIYGASIGDSGVWVIGETRITNLSEGQSRKPFVGSGGAWAIPFSHRRTPGAALLLATDGLLKYTSAEKIAGVCLKHALSEATTKLIELVRYPSGELPDDVTVIVAKL